MYSVKEVQTNVLSGLTVALAMVPEAIAFALVALVAQHGVEYLFAAVVLVGLL